MNHLKTICRAGIFLSLMTVTCISHASENSYLNQEKTSELTLQEAIEKALALSKKMEFLTTSVEISDHRLDSARSIDNPELRLRERMDLEDNDEKEYEVSLRWDVPRYGELEEAGLEAELDYVERKIRLLRYRHKLINRVRSYYSEVLLRDQLVEIARKRLELETQRLNIVEQMVSLGHRSIVYMTKSRMWLAESTHEYNQSIMRQKAARRKLARITDTDEDVQVVDNIDPFISQPLDELIDIAFKNRPEIELAKQQEQLAEQKLSVEKLKLYPRPRFVDVSYGFDEKNRDSIELHLGIELPVFNRNSGNINASELAVRRKEYQARAIREEITEEINDAHEVYTDCLIDWQNFSRDLAEMINETGNVINQAENHDVLSPDEVIELDIVLLDIQKILAEKRTRLLAALSDLFDVMGVESEKQLER